MAETHEAVAWELFRVVANAEGKSLHASDNGTPPTRKWVFETYAECLAIVRPSSAAHGVAARRAETAK